MSWRSKVSIGVAAVLVGVLSATTFAGSEPVQLEQVGVEVDIGVVDSPAGIYECTAVVTDLVSQKVVSAPKVRFRAGEEGQIRSGTQPGLGVHIKVSVSEDETEARYSASIYRDAEVISSQRVRVALGRL